MSGRSRTYAWRPSTGREDVPAESGVQPHSGAPQPGTPVLGRGVPTNLTVKPSGDHHSETKEPGAPLKGLRTARLARRHSPWAPRRDSGSGGTRDSQGKTEL